jgi:hypothetical protein
MASTQGPTAMAVAPFPAESMQPAPEAKTGVSPPEPASSSGPPESDVKKSAHIAVQVSNALLGLTINTVSNSATAPSAVQPASQSATAMTATAVGDAAPSQAAGNDSAGSDMNDFQGSGGGAGSSANNASAQNGAGAAKSQTGSTAQGQSAANFSPLPVIPQWHIQPRMRTTA